MTGRRSPEAIESSGPIGRVQATSTRWPAVLTGVVDAAVTTAMADSERQVREILDAGHVPIHIAHGGRDEYLPLEEAERCYGPLDPVVVEDSTRVARAWWEYADRVATGTPYENTVDASEFARLYLDGRLSSPL